MSIRKWFSLHAKAVQFSIIFALMLVVMLVLGVLRKEWGSLPAPEINIITPAMRSAAQTDFTLADLTGKPMRLADFRGKVVLLNFFATWCPPCREEMPALEKLFQTYNAQQFVVLGVANDSQGETVVAPFVKKYQLTFPVVLDVDQTVSRQYWVRGIPVTYLLDRQGRIASRFEGSADWNSSPVQAFIARLLQEER